MRNHLSNPITRLSKQIDDLSQVEVLIHVLAKSDLNELELCEIQDYLQSTQSLLASHIESLRNQVAVITGGNNV